MSDDRSLVEPDTRCLACPVGHRAICRALGDAHRHNLTDIMMHRRFSAGTEIMHQEDDSKLFAIIVSGSIKLTRVISDGRQQIVGLLSESDCLGDVFSVRNHDGAECITDVELCCFQRKRFDAILKAHPELEHRLLEKALEDLQDARQWMIALGCKTAKERIATFLVWLSERVNWHCFRTFSDQDSLIITLPFTRAEMGDFLGLTIETVSRTLTKLKSTKVISFLDTRRIEIHELDKLRRIAEHGG